MNNLPQHVSFAGSQAPIVPEENVGAMAAVSREQSEIQSAIISAKKFPRDELKAYTKCIDSFKRPTMAMASTYNFERGGKAINGPSVDTARELARCWGNIRYGLRIVKNTKTQVQIKGYSYDLESNTFIEAEDEFDKLIQRKVFENGSKVTKWVEPDERDLRELINRRGAILVRNCILQVIPSDITEDVIKQARLTLNSISNKDLTETREDTIRRIAMVFNNIGIPASLLEKKLQHPLATITAEELTDLRGIYKSIMDGNTKAHEHFDFKETETDIPGRESDETNAKLKAQADKVKAANAAKKEGEKDAV